MDGGKINRRLTLFPREDSARPRRCGGSTHSNGPSSRSSGGQALGPLEGRNRRRPALAFAAGTQNSSPSSGSKTSSGVSSSSSSFSSLRLSRRSRTGEGSRDVPGGRECEWPLHPHVVGWPQPPQQGWLVVLVVPNVAVRAVGLGERGTRDRAVTRLDGVRSQHACDGAGEVDAPQANSTPPAFLWKAEP